MTKKFIERIENMNKKELWEQYQKDLENAESTFEKNLLKAEYDHKIQLLGLNVGTVNTCSMDNPDCEECGA